MAGPQILRWLATCVSGDNDNLHWPVMREGFEICFVVSRDPTQPRLLFLFIPPGSPCAPNHMAGPRARRCCCCCCTGTFFIAFCHVRSAKACRARASARSGPAQRVGRGDCGHPHTHKRNNAFICMYFFSWFLPMRKCKFR